MWNWASVEFLLGLLVGILAVVLELYWWIRLPLVILAIGIIWHLVIRRSGLTTPKAIAAGFSGSLLVGLGSWYPIWVGIKPQVEYVLGVPPIRPQSAPVIASALPTRPTPQQMPPNFLLSLFMTDHNNMSGAFTEPSSAGINVDGRLLGKLFYRVDYDNESHTKFILIFIPAAKATTELAYYLSRFIGEYLESDLAHNPIRNFQVQTQGSSNVERFTDYPFSGRVYVYHETPITAEDIGGVTKAFREAKMDVELLGTDAALGVWSSVQLGIVKPLPYFDIDNDRVCIKGPPISPLPIPVRPCKPVEK